MKGKIKGISLLLVAVVAAVTLTTYVKAKEVCTTHKNYYFFNSGESSVSYNRITNAENNGIYRTATYFPDPNINGSYTSKYEICLKKGDIYTTDNNNHCEATWDLEEFYNKQKNISNNNPRTGSFNVDNITEPITYKYIEEVSTDANGKKVITTYFKHGKWFKVDNTTLDETEGGAGVNYLNLDTATIIKGTVLPINDVQFANPVNGYIRAQVNRTMIGQTGRSTTFGANDSFPLVWPSGSTRDTIILPALYYIEYETCETVADPDPTYKVTVNYYYYKDGKPTKEKYADSYSKPNLADGATDEVTYPTPRTGCEIVNPDTGNPSGETGKTFTIQGADIVENVYYYCKNETTYKATINYYYFENGKPTTDKYAESYSESKLNVGDERTITSPAAKSGCTIVDSNGNAKPEDKEVSFTIKNSDFKKNVYYYCKTSAEPNGNAKTGDGLVYASIILAFVAIGLGTYYFIAYGKAKKEEA